MEKSVEINVDGMAEGDLASTIGLFLSNLEKEAGTPIPDQKIESADGTPVEDELLAEIQLIVDAFNAQFLGDVAKGRRMSRKALAAIADGRTFVGEKAVDARLVDEVATFDEVFASLGGNQPGARANAEYAGEPEATWQLEISGDGRPHAGLTLAEESDEALAAVRGLTARFADLKETRAREESRGLSPAALGHVDRVFEAVNDLLEQLAEVAEPYDDPRQKLARAVLSASIGDSK
ncbi:MAG: S49 family peptidase [Armatimonadetes bacterium]|nr:S49 family peptidase [Armatimonadota bacterium]